MKKIHKYLYDLFLRLALTLLVSINSLALFYFIFTPLTVYPSYWILKVFYPVIMQDNFLLYNTNVIEIINACIAGSAYYLLIILNLTTKGINWITRIKAFIFSSLSLLVLNILRIVILAILLFSYPLAFTSIHIAFWLIGSTLFVVAIWIATIKIYNIKEIPIYSDLKEVLKLFRK